MSVGRLGVIVSVTMRVEENSRTERHVKVMSAEELIEELDRAGKEFAENNFYCDEIADEPIGHDAKLVVSNPRVE